MAQAVLSDTGFEVTDEMRGRYVAWVESMVEATGMPRDDLMVEHEPWMHPLDALALIVSLDGDRAAPPEQRAALADAFRTSAGLGEPGRVRWTAKATGLSEASVKQYVPDRRRYDLQGRTALYRYFDVDGRLLYVGVAKDPDKRDREHHCTSEWYEHAVRREIEWHDTRQDALAAERQAIRNELPLFNRHGARVDPEDVSDYVFWRHLLSLSAEEMDSLAAAASR